MKPVYQEKVQSLITAYENQILSIQKELSEEFKRKMNQRTGHLQEALTKLYRKENEKWVNLPDPLKDLGVRKTL